MNPTETYTGLTHDQYSKYAGLVPLFPKYPTPPPLPPLQSLRTKVTMDTAARLPSTWRSAIGKVLTNKRIIEYQRDGRYGSGLKLPPAKDAGVCCIKGCNSKINTRKCSYDYLPTPGVYCKHHRDKYRAIRDVALAEAKRLKELELATFINEYV